jgi:hypothetical protein
MDEIPELNTPNNAADKDPSKIHITPPPIKSDKDVVGGVVLGAIDQLDLDSTQYNAAVDVGVAAALKFKPSRLKPVAVASAVVQMRQDLLTDAPAYVMARRNASRTLTRLVSQDRTIATAAERRSVVTSLLLERTVAGRMRDAAVKQVEHLTVSQNLLRFQTTVGTTFMKQKLALAYRQLYATNTLISLTKAFADMVENKLEAIKINTKLPDSVKPQGVFRRIKNALVHEAFAQASKYTVHRGGQYLAHNVAPGVADYLSSDVRPNLMLRERLARAAGLTAATIRQSEFGARVLNAADERARRIGARAAPYMAGAQARAAAFDAQHHVSERFAPDVLWEKGKTQRKMLADLIRSLANVHAPKPHTETIKDGGTDPTSPSAPRAPPGSQTSNLGRRDIQELVTSRLDKIYEALIQRFRQCPCSDPRQGPSGGSPSVGPSGNLGGASAAARATFGNLQKRGLASVMSLRQRVMAAAQKREDSPTSQSALAGAVSQAHRAHRALHQFQQTYQPIVQDAAANFVMQAQLRGGAIASRARAQFQQLLKDNPRAASLIAQRHADIAPVMSAVQDHVTAAAEAIHDRAHLFGETTRTAGVGAAIHEAATAATNDLQSLAAKGRARVSPAYEALKKKLSEHSGTGQAASDLVIQAQLGAGLLASRVPSKSVIRDGVKSMAEAMPGAIDAAKDRVQRNFSKYFRADLKNTVGDGIDRLYKLMDKRLPQSEDGRSNGFAAHNKRLREELSARKEQIAGLVGGVFRRGRGGQVADEPYDETGPTSGSGDRWWVRGAEGAAGAIAGRVLARAGRVAAKYGYRGAKATLRGAYGLTKGSARLGWEASKLSAKLSGKAAKVGLGVAGGVASELGLGTAAKVGGKFLLKKAPLIGLGISTYEAGGRILDGDFVGAGMELAAGGAAMLPGAGTAASIGIDGAIIARDYMRAGAYTKGVRGQLHAARIMAYGGSIANTKIIHKLEDRVAAMIEKNEGGPIRSAEFDEIAKEFGFDIKDARAREYLNTWIKTRFVTIFRIYLALLKSHGYTYDTEVNLSDSDGAEMLEEFGRFSKNTIAKYSTLAPSMEAYRRATGRPTTPDRSSPTATTPTGGTRPTAPVVSFTPPTVPTTPTSSWFSRHMGIGSAAAATPPPTSPSTGPRLQFKDWDRSDATTPSSSAASAGPSAPGAPQPVSPFLSATPLASASSEVHAAAMTKLSFNAPYKTSSNNDNGGLMGGAAFRQKAPGIMQNLMKDFSLTQEQAAGIVGNIGHEAGGFQEMQEKNPVGGGRGGLGWAQWTGDRRVAFEKYSKDNGLDPYSDAANYGFLKHELSTTYKSSIDAVKQTNDPQTAMRVFEKHYEAAGIKHYESRAQYTNAALQAAGAGGTAALQAAGAGNTATNGSTVVANNTSASGDSLPKGRVGSGQCVDLVKDACGIGHTSTWQQGATIANNPDLKPGTAIATFDQNGKYGNHTNGSSHAAIYLGPSTKYPGGIRVYDQWAGHPASERDIRPSGGSAVNSANAYSIIKTSDNPTGVVAAAFKSGAPSAPIPKSTDPMATPTGAKEIASATTTSPPPPANTTVSAGQGSLPPIPPAPSTADNTPTGPAAPSDVAPMRTAMATAQASQRLPLTAPPPPPPSPAPPAAAPTPSPVLGSDPAMMAVMQQMTAAVTKVHTEISGLHQTTKDAFGKDGVLSDLAASQKSSPTTVIAPSVTQALPPKQTADDGLDVSKKRQDRYAA